MEGVLADDEAPEHASNVARAELARVEAVIVVHSRERDDLRGEVAKLQQAWEAESAGLRASLRGAEAQVKSHADDARAAAATHDALLGSSSGRPAVILIACSRAPPCNTPSRRFPRLPPLQTRVTWEPPLAFLLRGREGGIGLPEPGGKGALDGLALTPAPAVQPVFAGPAGTVRTPIVDAMFQFDYAATERSQAAWPVAPPVEAHLRGVR